MLYYILLIIKYVRLNSVRKHPLITNIMNTPMNLQKRAIIYLLSKLEYNSSSLIQIIIGGIGIPCYKVFLGLATQTLHTPMYFEMIDNLR